MINEANRMDIEEYVRAMEERVSIMNIKNFEEEFLEIIELTFSNILKSNLVE